MNTFHKILIFLSVLGPSVITTMAGNDGGGVITYSLAGARLGYAALIILPILTLLYAVTQEMGSRVAIVTGKGLGDLIREQFGARTAIGVFVLLLIANFGTVLTNVAALKTSSEMLGLSPIVIIIAAIIGAFLLVTLTQYEKSQKIFLTGIVFYFAYVFSAAKAQPDWIGTFQGLFIPPANLFSPEFIVISVAVLGTTITPWGQFFVQSYMKDKNVAIAKLGFAKLEAYVGAFLSNFFTFFIMIATAATLFVNRIPLQSGEQAALAIAPFAGSLASLLFAVGLINASVIGMIIVSLSSAYAFTEFFGFAGSLDEPYSKGKTFYGIFLFNLILAAVIVFLPWISLFKIVIFTQALNGILLPLFLYYLLRIVNDRELMGEHVNGKFANAFSIVCSCIIVLAGVFALFVSFFVTG